MKIEEPEPGLVAAAVEGDLGSIDALLRTIQPGVFNLAVRMLGNREDAGDATQEILLKVVTHLAGFRGDAAFATWVFRIARNHLLTALTRSRESPETSLEAMGERLQSGIDFAASLSLAGPGTPLTPEDKLAARQVAIGCTQAMLMTLDREQRLAYVLDAVFGVSAQDGADVLEIEPAAYRQRLSRARRSLDPFVKGTCGLVNADAACRCERQLPALREPRSRGAGGPDDPTGGDRRARDRRCRAAVRRPGPDERCGGAVPRPPGVPRTGDDDRRHTRRAARRRLLAQRREASPAMTAEPFAVAAADGVALAATLYRPPPQARPRRAVLVAGALGVDQRFYAPFATWLAERGDLVMTFDLRGIGASRAPEHRHTLRGLDVDMLGWARLDFAAAVDALADIAGGPVTVVGHSLGAHHAGLTGARAQAQIARLVAVAAGSGSWRTWAAPARRRAPLMLHVAVPCLTPLFGYFPGRRLKMVGDLPAGVALQWSRWCRHPDFAWGSEPELVLTSLASARFPIHALSFSDDEAMTEACTRHLLAAFVNAPAELETVRPAALGLDAIGHLGGFRRRAGAALWPLIEARLG